MSYAEVANLLVIVTNANMIRTMAFGYGTLKTTAVRMPHQVWSPKNSCTEVSAALEVSAPLKVSHQLVQRSQQHQYLTLLYVKYPSLLNATLYLLELSESCENAPVASESMLLSSRGARESLQVHRRTSEVDWSVWNICIWPLDIFTLCWYSCLDLHST